LAAQDPARTESFPELGITRIEPVLRILLRVEVIEVAVEFVEAVHRRQELVTVAEVVLSKLSGRVAQRLEQLGQPRIPCLQTYSRSRDAHFRQAGAQGRLAGNE